MRFTGQSNFITAMAFVLLPAFLWPTHGAAHSHFGALHSHVEDVASGDKSGAGTSINLYSYRRAELIEHVLKAFTEQTGIKVNLTVVRRDLISRVRDSFTSNPADAILTEDVGRLARLRDENLLIPIFSEEINMNVPKRLRSPSGYWFGLTQRARIAVVSRSRALKIQVRKLADLADPRLKGRLCLRSFYHPYNIAVVASIMAHSGRKAAEEWLDGLRKNLARAPEGGDRAQIRAIKDGVCDVALVNNYYLAGMATNNRKPEEQRVAAAVEPVFLDQDGHGQHMNISGIGVTVNANNPDGAVALIEFLTQPTAQRLFASRNQEYPVNPTVPPSMELTVWGPFKPDTLPLGDMLKHHTEALLLVNDMGF